MRTARVLITDPSGLERWQKGDVGNVLINDSTKYDFKIKFPGKLEIRLGKQGVIDAVRVFYFYRDEVTPINP